MKMLSPSNHPYLYVYTCMYLGQFLQLQVQLIRNTCKSSNCSTGIMAVILLCWLKGKSVYNCNGGAGRHSMGQGSSYSMQWTFVSITATKMNTGNTTVS